MIWKRCGTAEALEETFEAQFELLRDKANAHEVVLVYSVPKIHVGILKGTSHYSHTPYVLLWNIQDKFLLWGGRKRRPLLFLLRCTLHSTAWFKNLHWWNSNNCSCVAPGASHWHLQPQWSWLPSCDIVEVGSKHRRFLHADWIPTSINPSSSHCSLLSTFSFSLFTRRLARSKLPSL